LGSYGADIDKINELRKAGFFGKHCGWWQSCWFYWDTAVELRFYQYIAGFSTMMERHGQSAIYALMLVLVNCILGQYWDLKTKEGVHQFRNMLQKLQFGQKIQLVHSAENMEMVLWGEFFAFMIGQKKLRIA
jgi:hypothetical protein